MLWEHELAFSEKLKKKKANWKEEGKKKNPQEKHPLSLGAADG